MQARSMEEKRDEAEVNRQGRVGSGVSLHTSGSEVQCVDPHRHGLLHQNIVQELLKQWAQIRTSIMQAGIDVTHPDQQLTSQQCCQRALFRMGGKCIAYMSFLVNTPLLLLLLLYPLFLLLSLLYGGKNQCALHPLPCSCAALCLSLTLLYFILFSLLLHKTSAY